MFLREHSRVKDGKEHGYWSLVETIRTADGPRQRTLCYLGELNGSAHARWQKTVEVFNEQGETTQLKLFPAEMLSPPGLRALLSVLPAGTLVWPVGGITADSISRWREAGANGFGIGSALFSPGVTLEELQRRASAFVAAWRLSDK